MNLTHIVNCNIAAKTDWLMLSNSLPFKLRLESSLKARDGEDAVRGGWGRMPLH